ncbi:hypothetical protein [Nocardiopsis ansamitocini]|uniref:Uncharacterized protein n=1 Tax=Nocardiopsis ansamitocini TaxID=1670832 RepID=A0A9W6UIE1_9ACTN|nr:hypothetical protein [Nocardiopsis ansamitocini]GLU49846.1 hypothetical protein Nans01_41970 [Nocardiopsis ansamitocini]
MNPRKKHPDAAPAITAHQVQKTVQDAKTLASIPGQELLDNPALNPKTRARYDELTTQRLEAELDLAHRRKLRDAHEADRREAERSEVDTIIAAARRATSPARTILDMTRYQARFGRVALAASLALSVGSAMGLAALVEANQGPAPVGYLAEIGLTGLSTTVIVWRGILARAGTVLDAATNRFFVALMLAPLLVSIVGSWLGTGPVGAACSIGSALFAGLAYLINTSASAAITQSIHQIDHQNSAPTPPARTDARTEPVPAPTATGPAFEESVTQVSTSAVREIEDYLSARASGAAPTAEPDRSHDDTTTPHTEVSGQVGASERPCEHPAPTHGSEDSERVLTAQERRRLEGERNRASVAAYLAAHPNAHTGDIAAHTGLGVSTVRRIRRDIEEGKA